MYKKIWWRYRYVYHVLKPILPTTATSSTRQGSCRHDRGSTTLRPHPVQGDSTTFHVQNNRRGLPFCQDLPEPLKFYNAPHTSLTRCTRQQKIASRPRPVLTKILGGEGIYLTDRDSVTAPKLALSASFEYLCYESTTNITTCIFIFTLRGSTLVVRIWCLYGDRLKSSESDVYRRHILTNEVYLCAGAM